MNHLEQFHSHRERLFGIAYRMLGSVHDAEDIVQEAWLRWERADMAEIANPGAFLCTMVTRMSIDVLRSARKRRETYVGEWLPEPLALDAPSASEHVALSESLSTAFLLMLERLNPVERAAFLLREVFGYDYPEVAEIIGKSEDNSRQIVRRAKERVQVPKPRYTALTQDRDALLNSFLTAVHGGDLKTLELFLADDAALYSDHGGKAAAAKRTILGARKIAKFFVGIHKKFRPNDYAVRLTWLNGAPGVIVYSGAVPETAFSLELDREKVSRVYLIRNPEKLRHLPQRSAASDWP